jgi:hypothetical protein
VKKFSIEIKVINESTIIIALQIADFDPHPCPSPVPEEGMK